VAAEFLQQARCAFGDEVERVAQVQAGDRAAGAFELMPPSLGAKAKTGRCSFSLMREARMPTTPSCQLSSKSAMPGAAVVGDR
jgi:hypothetical protein